MKTVLNTNNVPLEKGLLFLGEEPLGIQRYDQFKHPIFFDLWERQENFRWRPQRIDLSKDKVDFAHLNEVEKWIFCSNLRWQTMADSMLSRSIHKVSEYITNPELEICVGTWASMENIHSFSYTYILKSIIDNPAEFFDSILQDKEIVKRADQLKNSYDVLLSSEAADLKDDIFRAVISTYIAEGVSFYSSFLCSFFFGYRGKMEGSAKIVSEIARDEFLHQQITQNILKVWKNQKEEGFQETLRKNQELVYNLFENAVEQEKAWGEYLFSKGTLLGLNPTVLHQYVEWLANNRMNAIGLKKIFKSKENPASWSNRYFNSEAVQNAPQEQELESYTVGNIRALNDSDLDDVFTNF